MRRLAVALAAASFALCANTSALAADYADTVSAAPSPEAMAVDFILIRPVGIVATVAGVGLFIASLPFDLFAMNFKDPAQKLIVEPAKFTFTRDLGDIP